MAEDNDATTDIDDRGIRVGTELTITRSVVGREQTDTGTITSIHINNGKIGIKADGDFDGKVYQPSWYFEKNAGALDDDVHIVEIDNSNADADARSLKDARDELATNSGE